MQILVVIAKTPERPWKTDVEKGFVCTTVEGRGPQTDKHLPQSPFTDKFL